MADPTNPLCPATKIFADFSDINEPGFMSETKFTRKLSIPQSFSLASYEGNEI